MVSLVPEMFCGDMGRDGAMRMRGRGQLPGSGRFQFLPAGGNLPPLVISGNQGFGGRWIVS